MEINAETVAKGRLTLAWNESDKEMRLIFVRMLCRIYTDVLSEELAKVHKGVGAAHGRKQDNSGQQGCG
jgi:hypothetical protein